ncbi:hypothetical protein D3C81_1350180 [compost metagenome]
MQRRHQHHRQPGQLAVGANPAGQGETVQPGHFHIRHQQVELPLFQCIPGLQAIVGGGHLVTRAFEDRLQQTARGKRVFGYQQALARGAGARLGLLGEAGTPGFQGAAIEIGRVQDGHQLAVPQHGGAQQVAHPHQLPAEALDDDFLVAQQFLYQ